MRREPSLHVRGQPVDFLARSLPGNRHANQSPRERNKLPPAIRKDGSCKFVPHLPEPFIVRMAIEDVPQFVKMKKARVAAQQMPQRVERRICDRVRRMKAAESQSFEFPALPPLPETIESLGREPLSTLVPELKMQLD